MFPISANTSSLFHWRQTADGSVVIGLPQLFCQLFGAGQTLLSGATGGFTDCPTDEDPTGDGLASPEGTFHNTGKHTSFPRGHRSPSCNSEEHINIGSHAGSDKECHLTLWEMTLGKKTFFGIWLCPVNRGECSKPGFMTYPIFPCGPVQFCPHARCGP